MFYSLASSSWGPEELQAIQRVVDSGMFSMGENVAAFEREFADYFGAKYGVMVNSGSSANLVAVAALCHTKERPLQRGDEVIVPAISWATTYHPLQQYGLKLKFIDVDLDTLNIDVEQIEKAIGPRTRMILAVSILGNPAAVDVMRKICDKHGLIFMEDNCESMDAEIGGRKTGTFGHVNTFSTFFSHHISTMEGGVVLTDDKELFHLMRAIRNHGWTRDIPADTTIYEKKDSDFFEAYRFILPGYNVRPIELSGAIGREQVKKLPQLTAQRRKNMAHFQKLFAGDERFIIQKEHGKSSSFCFTIIVNPKRSVDRARVFEALKKADIGYRIITGGNFLRHDVIKYFDYEVVGGSTPNADIAHDYGFFVGNAPIDLTPQIDKLREVLDRACN